MANILLTKLQNKYLYQRYVKNVLSELHQQVCTKSNNTSIIPVNMLQKYFRYIKSIITFISC